MGSVREILKIYISKKCYSYFRAKSLGAEHMTEPNSRENPSKTSIFEPMPMGESIVNFILTNHFFSKITK